MEEQSNDNSVIKAKGIEFDGGPMSNFKDKELVISSSNSFRSSNDFTTFEIDYTVPYTDAADANYYPIFHIATTQCFLIEAKMRHAVAGGASAEVNVIKVPSGTAKSVGQSMLVSAFDLTAAANTVQSKTISVSSVGVIQLAPGDAIALRARGTLTNASEVCVTVLLGVLARDLPTGPNV